jgi:hypothetical protein
MNGLKLIELGAGAGIGFTLFLLFSLVGAGAVLWFVGWIKGARR